jgi:hypothetical protein
MLTDYGGIKSSGSLLYISKARAADGLLAGGIAHEAGASLEHISHDGLRPLDILNEPAGDYKFIVCVEPFLGKIVKFFQETFYPHEYIAGDCDHIFASHGTTSL